MIFVDCYIVNYLMGFVFFFCGGGVVYYIVLDMDIIGVECINFSGGGLGIYLDSNLNFYVSLMQLYKVLVVLMVVNIVCINDLKIVYNGKGQYIKNFNVDNIIAGKIVV